MKFSLLKKFIPPIVIEIIKKSYVSSGWFGNYSSWEEALKASSGYNNEEIFSKVKEAALSVKKGEAAYERDSVLFDKVEYSWPLLASLMWVAAQNRGTLRIIDFGGALGSSYFQNRVFLKDLKTVEWNIVEQGRFVEMGKKFFEDEKLKFFCSLEDCIENGMPETLLLGCVLPYIEKPRELVKYLLSFNFKFILIDRNPFIEGFEDRLTIQKVAPTIYKASYPAWFFNKSSFLELFEKKYDVIETYSCADKANIKSEYIGIIMKLKNDPS